MRSNYINSTSGREYLSKNGFIDIDFLYDVKILAARSCFPPTLAIFHCACAVSTYYYFRYNILRPIWIHCTNFL